MARFRDIPQFTRTANYHVNVSWAHLENSLKYYIEDGGLNLDPDFQRAHVWDDDKRRRYVEYILRGGMGGKAIYTNCPDWNSGGRTDFVLVDGKQRIEAATRFLRNELTVFDGHYYRDYEDRLDMITANFSWHVNDLDTRAEVLQWYLDLNSGGVIHTEDELERVRVLLEEEQRNPNPKDVARAAEKMAWRAERKAEMEERIKNPKPDANTPLPRKPSKGKSRG